jgi:hypothetical protein
MPRVPRSNKSLAQVVRFEADYRIMMDSRQTDTDVPESRWPTRVGLALAGFLGGLLYLYFLIAFVGLWMRTQSFSPIQLLVNFGTPALELSALVVALFMARNPRRLALSFPRVQV